MKSIFDEEELAKYDSPPDDDPEDDDEETDITSSWEEAREAKKEQELEKQLDMSNFGQGVFQPSNPWGQQVNPFSPWGNTQQQQSSPWGTSGSTPGFGQQKPAWTGSPFGGTTWGQQQQQSQGTSGQVIPRSKKVIFCDLLDCLVSSIEANGRLGVTPRGIYDIYIRRDIVDKIACFGPQWVFVLTNQSIQRGTDDEVKYSRMTDYICAAVADLCRLPIGNVQCITKTSLNPYDPYTKPNTGLIDVALERLEGYGITKADTVVLGSQSGFQGQSDRDYQMALNAGIDYIDIQQLITLYK